MTVSIEFIDDTNGRIIHNLFYRDDQPLHFRPQLEERVKFENVYYKVTRVSIALPKFASYNMEVTIKLHNCALDSY